LLESGEHKPWIHTYEFLEEEGMKMMEPHERELLIEDRIFRAYDEIEKNKKELRERRHEQSHDRG